MKPGRELDLLIAQKVFGYGRQINALGPSFLTELPNNVHRDRPVVGADENLYFLKKYSTDIAAAWEVVEKMIEETEQDKDPMVFTLDIHPHRQLNWDADFTSVYMGGGHGYANADTAPLAICLAALKARGIEV